MPFFSTRRDLCNGPLIDLPNTVCSTFLLVDRRSFVFEVPPCTFLQTCIIEPDIVIPAIVSDFVFVLDSTFAENGTLESYACAMLFFEFCISSIECARFGTGNARESELGWYI